MTPYTEGQRVVYIKRGESAYYDSTWLATYLKEHSSGRHSIRIDGQPRTKVVRSVNLQPAADGDHRGPWRCFHCNMLFNTCAAAELHFGRSMDLEAGCRINLTEYRRMEEAFRRSAEEDTDLHRELREMEAKMARAVRRAEEEGYAKGLADFRALPDFALLLEIAHRAYHILDDSDVDEMGSSHPVDYPAIDRALGQLTGDDDIHEVIKGLRSGARP